MSAASWHGRAVARVRPALSGRPVVVFDLDGVVRDFTRGSPDAVIEADLGLPAGGFAAINFHPARLHEVVTGRIRFGT